MRPRSGSKQGPRTTRDGRTLELVRVRGTQRDARDENRNLKRRGRRRGGRGRGGASRPPASPPQRSIWDWLRGLFTGAATAPAKAPATSRPSPVTGDQEARVLAEFCKHFGLTFRDPSLLKLALTHRSYLSVTGQGPRESNERLEFLGDSVLGLVTSEHLYRLNPGEHEGQLTKTKSLLVSKAILSRRALAMGLGRFVLMSHSEVESGGRQRLSIIADAFESVIGAIYLDQGFEASRGWIERWLLQGADEIMADKRHVNYKSHLQEYVQSTFRTHPVYRIRSEMGPDHSKHFNVEVMVGRRLLGEGKGRNKKEAEQAAARDALDRVGGREPERAAEPRRPSVEREAEASVSAPIVAPAPAMVEPDDETDPRRRRGRRGGRGRRGSGEMERTPGAAPSGAMERGRPVEREHSEERDRSGERERPAERDRSGERDRPGDRERERGGRERISAGGPFALPPEDGRFERLRLEAEKSNVEDLEVVEVEAAPEFEDDDFEEVGRPEGPHEDLHVDLYAWENEPMLEVEEPELVSPREVLDRRDIEPEVESWKDESDDDEPEALREGAKPSAARAEPPAEWAEPRMSRSESREAPASAAPPAPRTQAQPPAEETRSPNFGRRRARRR